MEWECHATLQRFSYLWHRLRERAMYTQLSVQFWEIVYINFHSNIQKTCAGCFTETFISNISDIIQWGDSKVYHLYVWTTICERMPTTRDIIIMIIEVYLYKTVWLTVILIPRVTSRILLVRICTCFTYKSIGETSYLVMWCRAVYWLLYDIRRCHNSEREKGYKNVPQGFAFWNYLWVKIIGTYYCHAFAGTAIYLR